MSASLLPPVVNTQSMNFERHTFALRRPVFLPSNERGWMGVTTQYSSIYVRAGSIYTGKIGLALKKVVRSIASVPQRCYLASAPVHYSRTIASYPAGVHGRRKERLVSAVCACVKLTSFIAQLYCIMTQPSLLLSINASSRSPHGVKSKTITTRSFLYGAPLAR